MSLGSQAVLARAEATEVATAEPMPIPEIVRRYAAGESLLVLEKECGHGVSRRTLYRWMLAEVGGEKYAELVTQCLVARVAEADEALEVSKTSEDITRAREMARFSRMDFERRRPALYGPKKEVVHSGGAPTLNIVLLQSPTGAVEKVIEGTSNVA